ncbi:YbaK/EbsC family protein [Kiloniella sp.]|uniref:YbaK/EbsC family protein n=1 Tax=Kiloniella sp. TaxID=1938587 RepID=UPI003B01FB7E
MKPSSVDRTIAAAKDLGLAIELREMTASTRTAEEAAQACDCMLGQIVKSLVFQGAESNALHLLLIAGNNQADLAMTEQNVGEKLIRADPKKVRKETGFAIGGVAPIGHLVPLPIWMDETLLEYYNVWAAAGAPNTVFKVSPSMLAEKIGAKVSKLAP